jgi:two-component system, chemotaxis family, sensor kinase CheA
MSEDILQEFLLESRENLDQLDRELVALEADPRNTARLASVFRTVHTVKGTAGFFQFAKLEGVAHAGENLLSKLRDGQLVLETVRTSALLAMVDAIRSLLDNIEKNGNEGTRHYGALIEALSLACSDSTCAEAGEALAELQGSTGSVPTGSGRPEGGAPASGPAQVAAPTSVAAPPPAPAAAPAAAPAPVAAAAAAAPAAAVAHAPAAAPSPSAGAQAQAPARQSLAHAPAAQAHAQGGGHDEPREAPREDRGTPHQDTRIRVDVRLLDKLMNLVGELVLARNQLLQHASVSADPGLTSSSQRLNLITTELQEGVMKTRMQPIDNIWSKFPRVVRDLSHTCGKQVKLEMEGKSTELDKTIIEAISDPLTHLVRNSVDHGIEQPAVRIAAGKPAVGMLKLRAYHEGGRVNIEIIDDGGGIDPERVKAKALERGLITPERARVMSSHDVFSLIFLPGFSTAAAVTNISGRGVGMDVVKSNIERMGGTVDVDSRVGFGTTIRIRIPLTLAIIPALVVGARGERFAIPQVNLVELVRIEADQASKAIERIHGVPVFRLRGNLLALAELSSVLGIDSDASPHDVNIVVLQADERQFGLLVDDIFDTEEIVVKPLGRELKGLNVYAGATIMGDGKVALILDVAGLAERTGVVVSERRNAHEQNPYERGKAKAETKEPLLLFRSGPTSRMAIPLRAVARLEEFARARVERVGQEHVVQYRGEILPLVYLSDVFGEESRGGDTLQVVVHTYDGKSVGFVVDAIEDVVEEEFTATRRGGRSGIMGSAVIQGRVTELLDADALRNIAGGL